MPSLAGVLPVFQTPFHTDESIDWDVLQREIDWLYERGADGIVMAMVSETLRLSSEERRAGAERAGEFSRGRGAVALSGGGENPRPGSSRHQRGGGKLAAGGRFLPACRARGGDRLDGDSARVGGRHATGTGG